ncbi:MAG TPA: DUF6318 family protein [Marmoricola sp.]|nr:DUF6318 family protein [Marmoricola sp.]
MTRRLIGVVVLLVALAGCGGDPKSEPPPSPSPSTTPVSTTPSAPAMPDAAKENTKAGAIAFVRHYVELINYAQATGDTSALAAVEDTGCASCARGRKYLDRVYRGGGHVAGGTWTIRTAQAKSSGENWAVTVVGDFAPSDVFLAANATPKHADGGPTLTNFVVWNDGNWKVRKWFSG